MNPLFKGIPKKRLKVSVDNEVYRLRRNHPYAEAILELARAAQSNRKPVPDLPERNDVKNLWDDALKENHKRLLYEIAKAGVHGLSQADAQAAMGMTPVELRTVHQSLARICEARNYERPLKTIGYRAENRRYIMDPDVVATVLKRSKQKTP